MQADSEHFYGTTGFGGANNYGTVFKINAAGSLTTLYSFCAQINCADGASPLAGLVRGTDGKFYGTTSTAGPSHAGTVFRISSGDKLTTLHSFCEQRGKPPCPDGAQPYAPLLQATNGTFYGTSHSSDTGGGTVFSLSEDLGPFVQTQTTSGKVGTTVVILGNDLTGATDVTFNGTEAALTVVSASEITATVPGGAATGTVQVVTPGGTLNSNVAFQVKPQ